MKTARFWHWHADSSVKLTLREGEELYSRHAWFNGEGWSSDVFVWSFDGEFLTREICHSGRDCDGHHGYEQVQHCHVSKLRDNPFPDWQKGEVRCFDQYAEAMGY
jgi:hypothetical protein